MSRIIQIRRHFWFQLLNFRKLVQEFASTIVIKCVVARLLVVLFFRFQLRKVLLHLPLLMPLVFKFISKIANCVHYNFLFLSIFIVVRFPTRLRMVPQLIKNKITLPINFPSYNFILALNLLNLLLLLNLLISRLKVIKRLIYT